MTTDEVDSRVERVFSSVFGSRVPFSIGLSRTAEHRWTSLKHIEFIIALEIEFGLRFDGADATDMTSIPVVLARVQSKLP